MSNRLIVIPLSFLRRLDSLKYTSFIALVSIGYLVLLVVAHFIRGDATDEKGPVRVLHWESAVATLSSFPVIVFAYTCHQNVGQPRMSANGRADNLINQMFSILNEIANNSHFRTTLVVVVSIGSAAFLYILVAITGYLSFGNSVDGNVVAQCMSSLHDTSNNKITNCPATQTPLQYLLRLAKLPSSSSLCSLIHSKFTLAARQLTQYSNGDHADVSTHQIILPLHQVAVQNQQSNHATTI